MTALDNLRAATARYEQTRKAHEEATAAAKAAVAAALRAGFGPIDVANASPFSDRYVRTIAAENHIEAAKRGPKPKSGGHS